MSMSPVSAPAVSEPTVMPLSIRIAFAVFVIILALTAGLGAYAWSHDLPGVPGAVFGLAKGVLLLWGIWIAHRLAWHWLRIVGSIAVVFLTMATLLQLKAGPPYEWSVVYSALKTAGLCIMLVALSRPSAKEYFGMLCSSCGQFTRRGAGLLLGKARGVPCDRVW